MQIGVGRGGWLMCGRIMYAVSSRKLYMFTLIPVKCTYKSIHYGLNFRLLMQAGDSLMNRFLMALGSPIEVPEAITSQVLSCKYD